MDTARKDLTQIDAVTNPKAEEVGRYSFLALYSLPMAYVIPNKLMKFNIAITGLSEGFRAVNEHFPGPPKMVSVFDVGNEEVQTKVDLR